MKKYKKFAALLAVMLMICIAVVIQSACNHYDSVQYITETPDDNSLSDEEIITITDEKIITITDEEIITITDEKIITITDEKIITITDEEIPLSNEELYSDAFSLISSIISTAIIVIISIALIYFGILFCRKNLWNT